MNSILHMLNSHKGMTITVALGLAGILVPIFIGLATLDKSEPGITYEIRSAINVLDVRTPLDDLEITFRGENIQEKDLNLRIYAIRVINTGDVDILQSHYDQEETWGLTVSGGNIIEARTVDASSDYLQRKATPLLLTGDVVEFPKAILEKGTFFAFDMLVLHPKSRLPEIKPFGKIAGIDEMRVFEISIAEEDAGFFHDVVGGGTFVLLSRLIFYGLSFAVLLVVSVFGIFGVMELRNWSRKRRVDRSNSLKSRSNLEQGERLKRFYINDGLDGLKKLKETLDAPIPIARRPRSEGIAEMNPRIVHAQLIDHQYSERHLEAIGAITREPRKRIYTVDQEFLATLNDLLKEFGT